MESAMQRAIRLQSQAAYLANSGVRFNVTPKENRLLANVTNRAHGIRYTSRIEHNEAGRAYVSIGTRRFFVKEPTNEQTIRETFGNKAMRLAY